MNINVNILSRESFSLSNLKKQSLFSLRSSLSLGLSIKNRTLITINNKYF